MLKKSVLFSLLIVALFAAVFIFRSSFTDALAQIEDILFEPEPDIPSILKNAKDRYNKEDFLAERADYFGKLRGLNNDETPNPGLRTEAIEKMEEQEALLRLKENDPGSSSLLASWTPIGPAPIPNGSFPWSGRTVSIDIHPTNPNIVYVGTAQGGLYRSTNGGTNWTPLMDGAMSLAIGAIAISPSNPETVYVGTGEHNFSGDSFFGVGVYRINNASTTATLTGPLNKDAVNNDIFTGRGISRIIVHPTDPNTIFVSTTSGVGGISGASSSQPSRGIYRSTNATAAGPVFAKLTGLAGNLNASVRDIAIDPLNPDILVAALVTGGGAGGIYRSINALAGSPVFTQEEIFNSTSTSELTAEFAVIHPAGDNNATFYAATGNLGGRVLASVDGGDTWTEKIDNNFCTPQCFYNIGIAVDPTNVNRVYLGGAPALVFGISTNGGTSFTISSSGVHVDSHVIAVSKSNPSTIFFGTDGGIYKSVNSGSTWASLNNSQFYATQFVSLDVHPTDANFTIGGTQDNGTNYYSPTGTWARVDGGDGGHAVIDQNAADLTNVRMYHTYFNSTSSPLLGYATRATVSAGWSFRGCNGAPANGINCTDTATLFYAPLERGPGTPNTVYYGTDRLYRSDDMGTNNTVVSQAPISNATPLSAIGIGPSNDNIRLVGLSNGQLWGTLTGASTLVDLDPSNTVPNSYISRLKIDPTNPSLAYLTIASFTNNIYKTTNLSNLGTSPVTWTLANGTGATSVPQVPANGFAIDKLNTSRLFVGTDIGVYVSTDSGATWNPFGVDLPRSSVFELEITNAAPRKLRVATHGKGMYEIPLDAAPTSNTRFDFDGDGKTDLSVFRPSVGQWWYLRSSDFGNRGFAFGLSTDKLAPADYTGDGKTDIALFRNGEWFVLRSEDNSFYAVPFGTSGDIPAPGDFDGDGKADTAVYRPSDRFWYIQNSSGGTTFQQFGVTEDRPVVEDYDGDGKDDIAVFRPSVSQWWLLRSTGGVIGYQFGSTGDRTVQGDYTGDGKADVALFRPSDRNWYILRSENSSFYSVPFGAAGDFPTAGDYDGDGKTDTAVFRPSDNFWYIQGSTSGFFQILFGTSGDVPVPAVYNAP